MSKKRRLHPLELAAKNASFDILRYIRKKYKEALIKRVVGDGEKMTDHATDLMRDAAKAFYEFRKKHQEVTEMHFYTDEEVQVNN